MKILKFFIYTFMLLFLLTVPIYSVGRIMLPKWVASQIASRLPEGSNLTIGEMSSKSNLGILYKGLKFEINNGVKLIISDFLVAPRLNFKKPLYLKASKVSLENMSLRVNFSNISSVLSIDYNDIGSSSLLGEMEDLKADELIAIQNIDFLIHGLSSKNSELEFKADQFTAQVLVPKGRIDLFGKKAVFSTELGDGVSTYLELDDVNLDLSMVQNFNQNSKIFGKNLKIDFNLLKRELWQLPISLELKDLKSLQGHIADKLNINANGRWNLVNKSCEWYDLYNLNGECGQLTDFLDIFFKITQKKSFLTVKGDGFCVTPNAACPQNIITIISTKNTAEIFSKLMSSGIINPLFAGIVLGSLLSSPNADNIDIDHEVTLEVIGNKINVNGKPLI